MNTTKEMIKLLQKELVDQGKIIEAGFASLKAMSIDPAASEVQLREMRMSFFAGAAHLFGSIMGSLDDGDEATDDDMRRMGLIEAELKAFLEEFKLQHMPVKGSA